MTLPTAIDSGSSPEDARPREAIRASSDFTGVDQKISLNTPPDLSLPKGGGAIRSLAEKFATSPATGTGTFTIALPIPAGRSGFGPQLSLRYDSGGGNGAFGLGWDIGVASISRKTAREIPRYGFGDETDSYVLSGAEDLVPVLIEPPPNNPEAEWTDDFVDAGTHMVYRYRPRTEGLFSRIERWQHKQTADVHWRSISKDNVTSIYGQSPAARVTDPANDLRVFRWLIEETRDDRGNIVRYEYRQENEDGIDAGLMHERPRLGKVTSFANVYLKAVRYGNKVPNVAADWSFHVVLDYGEHDPAAPQVAGAAGRTWAVRPDPFSSCKSGFEIRTYRLCERILVFQHFPQLGVDPSRVRAIELTYDRNPVASYLTRIVQRGYRLRADGTYITDVLPPLEFEYTTRVLNTEVHALSAGSLDNLPEGVDGSRYRWIDLDSEGISGVLHQHEGAWYYKRNLGGAQLDAARRVDPLPVPAQLSAGHDLVDLAGDGRLYLVHFGAPVAGYQARTADGGWEEFRAFESRANVDFDDANLRVADLNGDGFGDLLISHDDAYVWFPSAGRSGFEAPERITKAADEEKGPRLVFADGTQSCYIADMSGDGLGDLVRIRNGEVCYWPNLGHGRFGQRVEMSTPPVFDVPGRFDQKRVQLADIDGSGTTDILYVDDSEVRIWSNQSGNGWSAPQRVPVPPTHDLARLSVADLFGNGTATLIWTSSLHSESATAIQYIDLMGGVKPHLLNVVRNGLGFETRIQYVASTQHYLSDRVAGKPWLTRLPFPVHVVERVEGHDLIAGTRLVTTYRYRHGYYDGEEREFRGFAFVEQSDTERISEQDLPPVITRSWFHTGWPADRATLSQQYEAEYFAGDQSRSLLPDTVLPKNLKLTAQEERELCRALRGLRLREEVYALDGSPDENVPYVVREENYDVERLQPMQKNRHAVFWAHPREGLEYHYERNAADPRVTHHLTLQVDRFGNVCKSATIAYPRRAVAARKDEQRRTWCAFTEIKYTNPISTSAAYRAPMPCESSTFEVCGLLALTNVAHVTSDAAAYPLSFDAAVQAISGAMQIDPHQQPGGAASEKRLIAKARTYYLKDDLSGPLPFGTAAFRGLLFESFTLALTDQLAVDVFGSRVSNALLSGDAGFVHTENDAHWWIPSGRDIYGAQAANQFYRPTGHRDAFGNVSQATYDAWQIMLESLTDPVGNRIDAVNDYQAVSPSMITDANGNRSEVAFDALGRVTALAVMGRQNEQDVSKRGDTIADPSIRYEYAVHEWSANGLPTYVRTLTREEHREPATRWQESRTYFDGSGRDALRKVQAPPGHAWSTRNGAAAQVDTTPHQRWIGSGKTIYDNKGNPIRKYEPYFTDTPGFDTDAALVMFGVTSTVEYDPIGRTVRVDHPDGTFTKNEFDAWLSVTYDANDCVAGSRWYADRQLLPQNHPDRRAAEQSYEHRDTPVREHLDGLGRSFQQVLSNGPQASQHYATTADFDTRGNTLSVKDAKSRVALRQRYDLAGNPIRRESNDAGTRWILRNAGGKVVRVWSGELNDADRTEQISSYDPLQRRISLALRTGGGSAVMVEKTVYGDSLADAVARAANLRGRMYQQYDSAGLSTSEEYDFKGNLIRATQDYTIDYTQTPDWSLNPQPALEGIPRTTRRAHDALNRVTSVTTPDGSVYIPTYNVSNQIQAIGVKLRGAAAVTSYVTRIDYNARGQRELLDLYIVDANGDAQRLRRTYSYDPTNFRLLTVQTIRSTDNKRLQLLTYTFDAVGNIVATADGAHPDVYFNGAVVGADAHFEFDALYRLIGADGREHSGQIANDPIIWNDAVRSNHPHPNDGQALRRYTQRFVYDEVGALTGCSHQLGDLDAPGQVLWNRAFTYEPGTNRIATSTVGATTLTYAHDKRGNLIEVSHLDEMVWDARDRLVKVKRGTTTAYYAYDASGQRVRKVVEKNNAAIVEDRRYIGPWELFEKREGVNTTLRRETLHIMDGSSRLAMVDTKTFDAQANPAVFQIRSLLRYELDNLLGSAVAEVDAEGQVIFYEEYHPYGTTAFHAVRANTEVSDKRYRYTGKERDEESGFYYQSVRYYLPWLARWASPDPIGLTDGANLYRYARNNPVTLHDPSGLIGEGPTQPIPNGVVPQQGFGTVLPYNQQASALYDAAGRRLTESEHVIPRGNLEAVTMDPRTGVSDYTDSHYHRDTTVRFERNSALQKTHGNRGGVNADNPTTARLKQTVRSGGSVQYRDDVFMSRIDNMKAARDATGSAVSDGAIHRAALGQDGNLFRMQRLDQSGAKLMSAGDAIEDFDIVEWNDPNATPVDTPAPAPVDVPASTTSTLAKTTTKVTGATTTAGSGSKMLQTGAKVLKGAGAVLDVGGNLAGAAVGGVQVGTGVVKIQEGKTAEGAIDIAEGSANLGMGIGAPAALKSGAIVAGGGTAAVATATLVAGASVALAAETARAAVNGEKTPIDIADEFYGTHFGDIYGWVTGEYSKK